VRRTGGYSILELVVALALTSLVVLVGLQFIAESMILYRDAGRAVRNSPLPLAMATVRRDIQDASGVATVAITGWSDHPLHLVKWDGEHVSLAVVEGALVRFVIGPMGEPVSRRVLIRGVTAWWWRAANHSTLDVRITVLENPDPTAGARSRVNRRTEVRRFVLRGSPGGRTW
jgi:hypothetical protein